VCGLVFRTQPSRYPVQAVKLTGSTTKEESNRISKRLLAMASRKLESREEEIKLCYVTVGIRKALFSKPCSTWWT